MIFLRAYFCSNKNKKIGKILEVLTNSTQGLTIPLHLKTKFTAKGEAHGLSL